MVLHTLHGNFENKERLKEILRMGTKEQNIIDEAIEIMNKNGSIKFSQDQKDVYIDRCVKKINNIVKGGFTLPKECDKKNYNIEALSEIIELKNTLIQI